MNVIDEKHELVIDRVKFSKIVMKKSNEELHDFQP
jgi:hypothetical protein